MFFLQKRKTNNGKSQLINSNETNKDWNIQLLAPPHSPALLKTKSPMYRRQSLQNIINARRCKECATSPRQKSWYVSGDEKAYVRGPRTPQSQRSGPLELFPGYDQELFEGRFGGGGLRSGIRGSGNPPEASGTIERRGTQGVHEVLFGMGGSVTSENRTSTRIFGQPSLSTIPPTVTSLFDFGGATESAFYRPVTNRFHKPSSQQEQPDSANQLFLNNPFITRKSHDRLPQRPPEDISCGTSKASLPIKQEPCLAPNSIAISGFASRSKSQKIEPSNSVIPTQNIFHFPSRVERSVPFNPTMGDFRTPSRAEHQTQTHQQTSTVHLTIKLSQNRNPVQISFWESPEVKTTPASPSASQPAASSNAFASSNLSLNQFASPDNPFASQKFSW